MKWGMLRQSPRIGSACETHFPRNSHREFHRQSWRTFPRPHRCGDLAGGQSKSAAFDGGLEEQLALPPESEPSPAGRETRRRSCPRTRACEKKSSAVPRKSPTTCVRFSGDQTIVPAGSEKDMIQRQERHDGSGDQPDRCPHFLQPASSAQSRRCSMPLIKIPSASTLPRFQNVL